MISFREASWDEIQDLRRRCFPEDEIEKPHPSRCFIAEDDGRAVAHLGFIPQTYVIGGNEYSGALAVDAMTDPAHRRQGLFRKVAAFARDAIRNDYGLSTAWQIRPAVLNAMKDTGWQPILKATVFMKWLWVAGSKVPPAEQHLQLPTPNLSPEYAHVQRTHDRFHAPYYQHTPTCTTRETTLKGQPTLAIVDLTARPVLPPTTARLAAALMTWRHPLLPALLRAGFLPSPYRFRFLVNVFDSRIDAKRAKWALTWADTDHL